MLQPSPPAEIVDKVSQRFWNSLERDSEYPFRLLRREDRVLRQNSLVLKRCRMEPLEPGQ